MKISNKFAGFLGFLVALASVAPLGYVSAASSAPGTNVISNGTIYMIADGQRRAYTSAGAFLSYGFNSWDRVINASAEDLALPEGSFIPPRDGKVVCSDRSPDKGTCYLITNGKRAGFVSADVFNKLGFSFSKTISGDVSFLEKDSDIANSTDAHRPGVLVNKTGTIYLVSSDGLMGIPSPEVLGSWGYTFADAITANANDSKIPQFSVISPRQGAQLKPSDGGALANATEEVIFMSYIDSYPALPNNEVSSPEDVAAILTLNNQLGPDTMFKDVYQHLSSSSIYFLNKLPTLKKVFESESHKLYQTESIYPTVKVFEGRQRAIVSETMKQALTNYSKLYDTVLVKESGIWKVDLVGTFRVARDKAKIDNPSDAYVSGTGSTDLSIVAMEYETEEVTLNDPNAKFLVQIANTGQTIIHKYILDLRINNSLVYITTVTGYKLQPGQELILSIPIVNYWNPNIILSPGQYRTDIDIGFDPIDIDVDISDNLYYTLTNFK